MSALESPSDLVDGPDRLAAGVHDLPAGLDQEPGDGSPSVTRSAADEPHGPLRADRMRVGEGAQDLDLAGDPVFVAALEAARCHLR